MNIADAIIYRSTREVEEILESIEHVDFIDQYGYTPLIETCIVNETEKAKLILSRHPDVNRPDLTGHTALHWAAENNNVELSELLIKHGADLNIFASSGLPVLAKPLLRKQKELKQLLVTHGASLTFAYDFINAKLLGHLFELIGRADIVNPKGYFIEIDYEGFFLESAIDLIRFSLLGYRYNYAARDMRQFFPYLDLIIKSLETAAKLANYQHYLTKVEHHRNTINALLDQELLILPVAAKGHALTLVRYRNLFAICDRAERPDNQTGGIFIYYMNRVSRLNHELIHKLIYEVQTLDTFHKQLAPYLGLQKIKEIKFFKQKTGNCSWANVEATIAVIMEMLIITDKNVAQSLQAIQDPPLTLFTKWRSWALRRELYFCRQGFYEADEKRKKSKASILASILFQSLSPENPNDIEAAMEIIKILHQKEFKFILDSYIEFYCYRYPCPQGENLKQFVRLYEQSYMF